MKRVNELNHMSDNTTEDVHTTTASETVINNKVHNDCDSQNQDNTLKNQVAEEKAARIFPLNILSNKFRIKDSNTLKGRYNLYIYL